MVCSINGRENQQKDTGIKNKIMVDFGRIKRGGTSVLDHIFPKFDP